MENTKERTERPELPPEVQEVMTVMQRMREGCHVSQADRRRMKARLESAGLREEDVIPHLN